MTAILPDLSGVNAEPNTHIPLSEVARRLGVKVHHATRLVDSGELQAIDVAIGKRKRCFRVSVESLEAFISSRQVKPAARVTVAPVRRPSLPSGVSRFCG